MIILSGVISEHSFQAFNKILRSRRLFEKEKLHFSILKFSENYMYNQLYTGTAWKIIILKLLINISMKTAAHDLSYDIFMLFKVLIFKIY